jgi:hypothetical protein
MSYLHASISRPAIVEDIRSQIIRTSNRKAKAGQFGIPVRPDSGLLRTKKANEWMVQEHSTPAPKALFGSFWFEGELCILFADTNLGKSILAVQIGDSLTKAYSIGPMYNQADTCIPVLYLDFELSSKQFEARYVDHRWGSYLFSDEFYRSEFNPEADDPVLYDSYETYVKENIEFAIMNTRARVLIIDNITYIRNGLQSAKGALPLMKMLKAIKTKYNLSVLVLAHTPKRNPFKPLTVNDLQGSKMLINFADSSFAIGQSHTMPGMRYLKQIKQRNQKEEYGENNICLISQEKYINFLRYKFEGHAHERDHLRRPGEQQSDEVKQQIMELHQQGRSLRQIAEEVGIHFSNVGKMVRKEKLNLPIVHSNVNI